MADDRPGAPVRERALSGIERRRALTAGSAGPAEQAHVELPVVRPAALLGTPVAARRSDALADVATSFSQDVAGLLFSGPLDATLAQDPELGDEVLARARRLAARAYPPTG
jgi:hypothetical protein